MTMHQKNECVDFSNIYPKRAVRKKEKILAIHLFSLVFIFSSPKQILESYYKQYFFAMGMWGQTHHPYAS